MVIKISRKVRVAVSLLIIFSVIFAGYFALRNHQKQAEASVSSKARFIGFPKMLFPPIDQSVVGWWKLNDAAGQTVVKDWTANGNTGTSANNILSATGYTGVANTAMSFNGTSDYVNLGSSATLKPTSAITLSAWVNTTSSVSGGIVASGNGNATGGYSLWVYVSRAFFAVHGSPDISLVGPIINTGQWVHLVGTYDDVANQIVAYVNGASIGLVTDSGGAISYNTGNPLIGAMNTVFGNPGAFPFNGSISDVRIYSRSLNAQEVKVLYMRGRP